MSQPSTQSTTYDALRQSAVIWAPPAADVLRLTGADRVDFLQRMTTNDIKRLRPNSSCVTVLTSPTAKIVHVFTVMADHDGLFLLPAPGEGSALERHLRGQIFFMDKVRVVRPDTPMTRLRVMGPDAATVLAGVGVATLPETEGEWLHAGDLIVLNQTGFDLPGYELLVPLDQGASVLDRLATPALDVATYTARRIELGCPACGAELIDEFSPLEAGLAWACADNKGCYTGQEIIARQVTYDKITRSLVGLRSDTLLAAGATVALEGRAIGQVTSAAFSPALQAPVALAILKRPYQAAGTVVTVDGVVATVSPLPLV